MEKLTYDSWLEQYKPIQNPIAEAGFDNTMFETFGEELEFVKKQPIKRVWTLCDEGGVLYIVAGFYHINRLGYFITEEAYDLVNKPDAFDVVTKEEQAELDASLTEPQEMVAENIEPIVYGWDNQHPHYDIGWWQDEAFDSLTILGYNDWVHHQLEAAEPRERPVEYLASLEDEQEAGTTFDPEGATIPELLEYCEEHSLIAEDDEERLDPNYWLGDRAALVDNVRSHMNGNFDIECENDNIFDAGDNGVRIVEAEKPE